MEDFNSSGRPRVSSDMTFALECVQVLDGSPGAREVELPRDLPEGRGVAVAGDVLQDVIQDLLLAISKCFH